MTSGKSRSYLRVDDLSLERTKLLFSQATQIKRNICNGIHPRFLEGKQIALVFSESSTRTKMSFQLAAQRLGAQCLVIDNVLSSSISKGESFMDTFWTLHSIKPDLFVIRCAGSDPLEEVSAESQIPIISAGFGSKAHPTQALLDAFTLQEKFGGFEGLKVLYVGDIDHSRVASSGLKLLTALGCEVGICGPPSLTQNYGYIKTFSSLDEGIQWCNVYIGLRVQFERHADQGEQDIDKNEYIKSYSLNQERLVQLSNEAIIMHPGPVNWGIEFQTCVRSDSRLLMWQQKENGVYTRAALMEEMLKDKL